MKTWIIILVTLFSLKAGAYFGDPHFFEDLNVEEQGIPGNLAYVLAYSDAVVVVEHHPHDVFHLLTVDKIMYARPEITLEEGLKIYIDRHIGNYFDNKRIIEYSIESGRSVSEGQITYFAPTRVSRSFRKSLFFLRVSSVKQEIIDRRRLEGIPAFKALNGEEGQIVFEEINEEPDDQKYSDFYNFSEQDRLKEIAYGLEFIDEQKKRWGIESSAEFVDFVAAFYSEEGLTEEQMLSPLGKRLQKDSVELTKELSKDELLNLPNMKKK